MSEGKHDLYNYLVLIGANDEALAELERLRAVNAELLYNLKMAVAWLINSGPIKENRMPRGLESFEQLTEAIAKSESRA